MPAAKHYAEGQVIGTHGLAYLREASPDRWVSPNGKARAIRRAWFECACGEVCFVCRIASAKSGNTHSCGCVNSSNIESLHSVRIAEVGRNHKVHGCTGQRLYKVWERMVSRCHNPKSRQWNDYGGRGIQVHEAWRHDPRPYIEYVETALGSRPSKRHSIDRIDNDGNYEPGNIRWASPELQRSNQRPYGAALNRSKT